MVIWLHLPGEIYPKDLRGQKSKFQIPQESCYLWQSGYCGSDTIGCICVKQQMNKYVAVTGNWDLGHRNRKIKIQDLSSPKIELEVLEWTHIDACLFSTLCEVYLAHCKMHSSKCAVDEFWQMYIYTYAPTITKEIEYIYPSKKFPHHLCSHSPTPVFDPQNHWPASCKISFPFSRTSCTWSHTVGTLVCHFFYSQCFWDPSGLSHEWVVC